MSKPVLGYWDLRGLAEPIRTMLEYSGVDYEDKRYELGNKETFNQKSWFDEKFSTSLDFPNIPYFMDGDTKLTENIAIIRHVARKHNLMPTTDSALNKCEVAEGVVTELRIHFGMMCYLPDFDNNRKNFFNNYFPAKMELLDKYLSKNKWLAGDALSYVDFLFCEVTDHICLMRPTALDKYENVCNYRKQFYSFPRIAAYRRSNRFKKLPIVLPIAQWNSQECLDFEK